MLLAAQTAASRAVRHLDLAPLAPFGAQILTEIDLAAAVRCASSSSSSAGLATSIRAALDEHGVLLLRGQDRLDPSTHLALGEWLDSVSIVHT